MKGESYKPNEMFPREGTLFANGTEHRMWESQCYGCRNYNPNASSSRDGCPIEVAVAMASVNDGKIPARIALRGAFAEPGPNGEIIEAREPGYIVECPERRGRDEPDDRPRRGPRPAERANGSTRPS